MQRTCIQHIPGRHADRSRPGSVNQDPTGGGVAGVDHDVDSLVDAARAYAAARHAVDGLSLYRLAPDTSPIFERLFDCEQRLIALADQLPAAQDGHKTTE